MIIEKSCYVLERTYIPELIPSMRVACYFVPSSAAGASGVYFGRIGALIMRTVPILAAEPTTNRESLERWNIFRKVLTAPHSKQKQEMRASQG